MKLLDIKVATYYYYLSTAGSYCGLRIFKILIRNSKTFSLFSRNNILEQKLNSLYKDPNSSANVVLLRNIEKILSAKRNYQYKKLSDKEAIKLVGSTLLVFKGLLTSSIPSLVAGLVLSAIFYLPLHILKPQPMAKFESPESSQSFIITEESLQRIRTPTEPDFTPPPPSGLRITQ